MAYDASEAYLEAQVMAASPLELVRLLYGAAVEAVRKARACLARGDIRGRSRQIDKAMAILAELAGSLDAAAGGPLAERLAALYDYGGRRLLEANLHQDDAALSEVLGLLTTIREAWDGLPAAGVEPAPAPLPASYACEPAGAGQSWSA